MITQNRPVILLARHPPKVRGLIFPGDLRDLEDLSRQALTGHDSMISPIRCARRKSTAASSPRGLYLVNYEGQ